MEKQKYAGFWIRTGATIIDAIIIMIITLPPLYFIYGPEYLEGEQMVAGTWDFLISYVFPFVVTIWFWQRFLGTPGKMATRLKIVDAKTGQKMSPGQSVLRYFAYIPSMLALMLGFVWVAFDPKKQGWHDKIAGTVVLRDVSEVPVSFESDA